MKTLSHLALVVFVLGMAMVSAFVPTHPAYADIWDWNGVANAASSEAPQFSTLVSEGDLLSHDGSGPYKVYVTTHFPLGQGGV